MYKLREDFVAKDKDACKLHCNKHKQTKKSFMHGMGWDGKKTSNGKEKEINLIRNIEGDKNVYNLIRS